MHVDKTSKIRGFKTKGDKGLSSLDDLATISREMRFHARTRGKRRGRSRTRCMPVDHPVHRYVGARARRICNAKVKRKHRVMSIYRLRKETASAKRRCPDRGECGKRNKRCSGTARRRKRVEIDRQSMHGDPRKSPSTPARSRSRTRVRALRTRGSAARTLARSIRICQSLTE